MLDDPRVDLWAVGATAFTLLSGRAVHDAESAGEMLVRTATQPALPLSEVVPGTPPGFARAIDRALALDSAQRWQTANEMRAALRAD